MTHTYDKAINDLLFAIDYQSDYSEEQADEVMSIAEKTIEKYGQAVVFNEWTEYLLERVTEKKEAINFMIAFYNFGGQDFVINDPYPFLSLLYHKLEFPIECEPSEERELFDTFDSIYVSMLINAGYASYDNYFELNLFDDHKFIDCVVSLKNNH